MEKVGETDFAASMTVNKDNTYHIEVTSVEGDVYDLDERIRHHPARRPPAHGHI